VYLVEHTGQCDCCPLAVVQAPGSRLPAFGFPRRSHLDESHGQRVGVQLRDEKLAVHQLSLLGPVADRNLASSYQGHCRVRVIGRNALDWRAGREAVDRRVVEWKVPQGQ